MHQALSGELGNATTMSIVKQSSDNNHAYQEIRTASSKIITDMMTPLKSHICSSSYTLHISKTKEKMSSA